MSSLKLTFFGTPQIERNGERITLDTRKALALLAYIALHKRAHSREKLTTLFWPESPADKAFTNLRQTLWVLKKHLTETWLDIRRYSVEIKDTPSLWIDVQVFHQHLEHAATHDHSPTTACPRCLPSLVAAIGLYTDDFLRGFTLSDSPDFDDWQCFQTDLLREKLVESVKKLVRFYASQHDLPHAIHYA